MNLYQLKVFYFAAKYGSLSKAADALYITQPAVTKQIQQIQNRYGLKLLNRFGKRMVLTDAGKNLFSIAKKVIELEKSAEEHIRDYQQLKSGNIKIISSESFGAYYLPFIIIEYSQRYPGIQISSNILPVEEVYQEVLSLNCDIGFVSYIKEDNSRVVSIKIIDDAIVLIVPPSHQFADKKYFTPSDLKNQIVVMHEVGSATRSIVDRFLEKNNIQVKIRFEFSNNETIKRVVESGAGIALISKNTAIEEIKAKKLVAIPSLDHNLKRSFYMIHHRDKYFSKPLQGFVNITRGWAASFTDKHLS